jgi:bifunctional DNA-binding transcriptional regulator/antitoxin component of YhaV-PrlF toxin-antitoxin module
MGERNGPPTAAELATVREAYRTKADQIRALDRRGYKRARIADALGVRYQYVRNVLEAAKAAPGVSEEQAPFVASPKVEQWGPVYRFTVGPGGTITLPGEVMRDFKLAEGRILVAERDGETLVLLSPLEAIRRVQALTPPWKEGQPLWSEELIAERRTEAARE